MIPCYFDTFNEVNLSFIDQVKKVRPYEYFVNRNYHENLNFVTSQNYTLPGIYFIEVSKHPHLWCSKLYPDSFNILDFIPSHVCDAVRIKKLRIVILSVIEGGSFTSDIDCFKLLTESFQKLNFPSKSVLIVSGNLYANTQYNKWCKEQNIDSTLEFIEGIEWTGEVWPKQHEPIFYKSVKNYTKFFNSLNRAHRTHRTDHLYFLGSNKLIEMGLVSGGALFEDKSNLIPTFIDVRNEEYQDILNQNYPLSIDIDSSKMAESHLAGVNNLQIFNNTLLTISTETFFDDPGMFITEKTFRPIAMGHPFIILGQVGILKKLQSYGFRTDFIDTSYDEITDHKKRFAKFHESFLFWINDDKEKYYKKWLEIVEHNLYLYKQLNFRKQYLDAVILSTQKYFKESF